MQTDGRVLTPCDCSDVVTWVGLSKDAAAEANLKRSCFVDVGGCAVVIGVIPTPNACVEIAFLEVPIRVWQIIGICVGNANAIRRRRVDVFLTKPASVNCYDIDVRGVCHVRAIIREPCGDGETVFAIRGKLHEF